jgi:hypothetical protein
MNNWEIIIIFLSGVAGAIAKDIIKDNSLVLPEKKKGRLFLGFLGGAVTGGVAGLLVDGQPLTAFLAGYTGTAIIENMLPEKVKAEAEKKPTIEELIRMIAKQEGVDPDLAVRVARCESLLDPKAININKDGSKDRGLYQINDKYHPEITDEQAFDPIYATKFFCKAYKEGKLSWWNATRECWQK